MMRESGLARIQMAVFWALFFAYIPVEEPCLQTAYGVAYRHYAARVPRIIGFLGETKPLNGFSGD